MQIASSLIVKDSVNTARCRERVSHGIVPHRLHWEGIGVEYRGGKAPLILGKAKGSEVGSIFGKVMRSMVLAVDHHVRGGVEKKDGMGWDGRGSEGTL